MEEIINISKTFYERASEDEKDLVKKVFEKLKEIKLARTGLLMHGGLDFNDVLLIYYLVNKAKTSVCCNECHLPVESYCSCLMCLAKSHNTYYLCWSCYGGRKFKHEHKFKYLVDTFTLVKAVIDQRTTDADKRSKGKKSQALLLDKEMEEIRNISKTFYERASEDEKDLVNKVFEKLKEIKLARTGGLDFNDVLLIYYLVNKAKTSVQCNVCGSPVESYCSCLMCLAKSHNTYYLCWSCYGGRKFKHEHKFKYLVDTFTLVKAVIDQRTTDADKRSKGKREMGELRQIAISHYQASTKEVQNMAKEIFQSMDTDGDKRVDLQEFLKCMGQEGLAQFRNHHFFKELDREGNGSLDFEDVMTLYYIVKSRRPFCDCCGNFISGVYFSCIECFNTPQKSFNMCHDCYAKPKHNHKHDGRSQFLDNYTLLQALCDKKQSQPMTTSSNAIVLVPPSNTYTINLPPPTSPNNSTAIIPAPNDTENWKVKLALKALDAILSSVVIVGGISFCSIM